MYDAGMKTYSRTIKFRSGREIELALTPKPFELRIRVKFRAHK